MSDDNNNLPTTYTQKQLSLFKKELKKAGGFDELMFQKKALERKDNSILIAKYPNTEKEYKEQFLIGEYESLRQIFNTEVPYVFWSKIYKALKAIDQKIQ